MDVHCSREAGTMPGRGERGLEGTRKEGVEEAHILSDSIRFLAVDKKSVDK